MWPWYYGCKDLNLDTDWHPCSQTIKVLVMWEALTQSAQAGTLHLCGPTCTIYLRLVLHNLNLFPSCPSCIRLLHLNTDGLNPCLHSEWVGTVRAYRERSYSIVYRFLVTVCIIDLLCLSLCICFICLTPHLWTSASFSANSSCNKILYFMWLSVTSVSVLVLCTQYQSALFSSAFCITGGNCIPCVDFRLTYKKLKENKSNIHDGYRNCLIL